MSTTEPFEAAAYGGPGWSPRVKTTQEEIGTIWSACGIQSEYAPLKSVLLHEPGGELTASDDPNEMQMIEMLNVKRAQRQHQAMARAYEKAGVTVHHVMPSPPATPNQMFCADLFFMTPEGAILARPASTVRAGEERWIARRLSDIGVPIIRSIRGGGTFEGADAMWLDSKTVIVGCGFRTNDEGADQLESILSEMGVELIRIDMSVGAMHLMGMLRIVAEDLAIAWPKRFVHRGVRALDERGYRTAWLPDLEEVEQLKAFNIVTLAPRKILMPAGCPNTQSFFEDQGVECITVEMDELVKAAGAIGCLSGVIERG